MGDPQWRAKATRTDSGGMSIQMEQGNLVCAFFRDEVSQDNSGQMSLVATSGGTAIDINEGVNSFEADPTGVALACYPPESHQVTAVVTWGLGRYELPLSLEEREFGMCLIGSAAPASSPPKPEENPRPPA